jgi:hypothetical protein
VFPQVVAAAMAVVEAVALVAGWHWQRWRRKFRIALGIFRVSQGDTDDYDTNILYVYAWQVQASIR